MQREMIEHAGCNPVAFLIYISENAYYGRAAEFSKNFAISERFNLTRVELQIFNSFFAATLAKENTLSSLYFPLSFSEGILLLSSLFYKLDQLSQHLSLSLKQFYRYSVTQHQIPQEEMRTINYQYLEKAAEQLAKIYVQCTRQSSNFTKLYLAIEKSITEMSREKV